MFGIIVFFPGSHFSYQVTVKYLDCIISRSEEPCKLFFSVLIYINYSNLTCLESYWMDTPYSFSV